MYDDIKTSDTVFTSQTFETATRTPMESLSVNKVVDDGQSGSDGYLTDPESREGVSDSLQ